MIRKILKTLELNALALRYQQWRLQQVILEIEALESEAAALGVELGKRVAEREKIKRDMHYQIIEQMHPNAGPAPF